MPRQSTDAGFTLTELMITVGIIGILAGVATPYLAKDKIAGEGREFASELARDLTRARHQAIAERIEIRAFFFSDRVEFRNWKTTGGALQPVAGDPTYPLLRVLNAKTGIVTWDVLASSATPPGSQALTPATPKFVDFMITGEARNNATSMLPAVVYIRNMNVGSSHPQRDFRIDVTPLTGYVALVEQWN